MTASSAASVALPRQQRKCTGEAHRRQSAAGWTMSIDDERKGAEKARDVLSTLSPSSTYADHIAHPLRLAANLATTASSQGFSSQAELNNIRSDATVALNAVIRALQTRTLTHLIIASAQTGRSKPLSLRWRGASR